jgi:flavin reductase (DIM6/NTAB) family NADH-FMN oxidoreductase RutF
MPKDRPDLAHSGCRSTFCAVDRNVPAVFNGPSPRGRARSEDGQSVSETRVQDARALRSALGLFATGVTIVTAAGPEGARVGVTANAFTSVSLDPPLVLVGLSRNLRSLPDFEAADDFAVHVLAEDHSSLAWRFATAGADKWDGLEYLWGANGSPTFADMAAVFECRKYAVHPAGDHDLYIGEVVGFTMDPDRRPLIFHGGRMTGLAAADGT